MLTLNKTSFTIQHFLLGQMTHVLISMSKKKANIYMYKNIILIFSATLKHFVLLESCFHLLQKHSECEAVYLEMFNEMMKQTAILLV